MCSNVYAGRTKLADGLPRDGLLGVWLTITVPASSDNGYLVVAAGDTSPVTSNLSFGSDGDRTNSVFVALPSATDGTVCVTAYNANTHVVVDVLALTLR